MSRFAKISKILITFMIIICIPYVINMLINIQSFVFGEESVGLQRQMEQLHSKYDNAIHLLFAFYLTVIIAYFISSIKIPLLMFLELRREHKRLKEDFEKAKMRTEVQKNFLKQMHEIDSSNNDTKM